METQQRYTQAELLAQARRRHYSVDADLFKRWVTLGLLDLADAESRGYRLGVRRTWPDSQRRLFLTLLDKHRGVRSARALTNIPVLTWLIWGDDFVPLRQVRRALETWADLRRGGPRLYGYRPAAHALVANLARPGADPRAKAALVDALVESGRSGVLDDDEVAPLLVRVVGSRDPAAQTDGERVLGILRAQWAARERFFEFTNGHFRWARAFYLYAQADYAQARPELAADQRFGKLHSKFDLQHVANQACHDVLFNLGIAVVAPPGPGVPEYLQLRTWLEGRGHLTTVVDVQRSSLLLPPGVPNGSLGIDVHITIDPEAAAHK